MSFPSTLSQLIPHSDDPNKNPFSTAIEFINKHTIIESDPGITLTILVSLATYCVILVVCLAIICLPNFQGADGHARRRWFIKRHYLEGYKQAYWIPNSGLVVALCHMVGSTIFLVFLSRRYRALKSSFRGTTLHDSAWFEMRWFPAYCSFFTQAWSTWFVRASNASLKGSRRFGIDPITFNTNLIALPVVVFIVAIVMILGQAAAVTAQGEILEKLLESLKVAALKWTEGERSSSNPQFHEATSIYSDFVIKSNAAFESIRTIGLFWTLMGIPTIIIYIFGVSSLLDVIKKRFQAVEECETSGSNPFSIEKPTGTTVKPKGGARKLRHSFIYLGLHYSLMAGVLVFHILIGLAYYLADMQTFFQKNFQAVALILSDSGSFFLLIALLVQLVRIVVEGQEQKFKTAKIRENKLEYEDCVSENRHADISLMT